VEYAGKRVGVSDGVSDRRAQGFARQPPLANLAANGSQPPRASDVAVLLPLLIAWSALFYPWIKVGWAPSWRANSLTVRFPLECAEF
jgi:hypothetical protein